MIQNAENKPSRPSIPDISDLLLLAQKHKTLIAENDAKISENFNVIKDIVHKPFVQTVLEQDSNRLIFPKGSEDAKQYLEMSLSCTMQSIVIGFVLGREYAEHYKENPKAILIAERLDSLAIPTSTQNELKRISEYGAFWIMRLDEMCHFARFIDKSTMLHGMDLHLSQVQTTVFHAFKDGVVNYYDGVFGTNFSKTPFFENAKQTDTAENEGKISVNNTSNKKFDEMADLEQGQFVIDKLLPAMEEAALKQLEEREVVKKQTMDYVEKAIKERNRSMALQRAVFIIIGIIIAIAIFSLFK
ncbi:MAG: hypothetical protein HND47_11395 [Chloroflexi bacterium]|nr:hypothetical protein [Chloroflexota bacterium]